MFYQRKRSVSVSHVKNLISVDSTYATIQGNMIKLNININCHACVDTEANMKADAVDTTFLPMHKFLIHNIKDGQVSDFVDIIGECLKTN